MGNLLRAILPSAWMGIGKWDKFNIDIIMGYKEQKYDEMFCLSYKAKWQNAQLYCSKCFPRLSAFPGGEEH